MNKELSLLKLYEAKGVHSGNEFLIYKEYCKEFILSCQLHEVAIIGIEGFSILPDKRIKPHIDEIADFSDIDVNNWTGYVVACADSARLFIHEMLETGCCDCYCFVLVASKTG